jgi:predicted nucleic acid-binding OB-fold protein
MLSENRYELEPAAELYVSSSEILPYVVSKASMESRRVFRKAFAYTGPVTIRVHNFACSFSE